MKVVALYRFPCPYTVAPMPASQSGALPFGGGAQTACVLELEVAPGPQGSWPRPVEILELVPEAGRGCLHGVAFTASGAQVVIRVVK